MRLEFHKLAAKGCRKNEPSPLAPMRSQRRHEFVARRELNASRYVVPSDGRGEMFLWGAFPRAALSESLCPGLVWDAPLGLGSGMGMMRSIGGMGGRGI